METAIAMAAAAVGGFMARTWYMAIVLGTIAGVIVRFGHLWVRTGSVARWEFDEAIVATVLHPVSDARSPMDTTTLLIILIVLFVLGGGYYGRGRWY